MNTHPYLRAFLAGVFVPTLVLPLILAGFILVRLVLQVPVPIERALVFPMALVPSLWGLWNMLWLGSHARTHLAVQYYGMLLPLLLMPAGAIAASSLGVLAIGATGVTWFHACHASYALILPAFLGVLAAYYLLWKYVVGFTNRVLGIA